MIYINFFIDSLRQAFHELRTNKLRTLLSLLGITIGIFSIISVRSAVDSFEYNIKNSFTKLGSDIVYIDKMPWNEDPGQNYWKYVRRPEVSYEDYEAIRDRSKNISRAAFVGFMNGKTVSYRSSSVQGAYIMAPTYDYAEMVGMTFEEGRYFTQTEYDKGLNKVILGHNIAEELFPNTSPIGKYVKFYGRKFQIIGVIEFEGQSNIQVMPFDDLIMINYNVGRKLINLKDRNRVGKLLTAQARPGVSTDELRDELTGILRAQRRIRPLEDNNFAINDVGMFNQILDNVFKVINIAGFFIGIFALIVGMISIANIMFVSVKERTNIIGIKKAIGAKRTIILLEFLFEAIALSILGGIVGLLLVVILAKAISAGGAFIMFLSIENVMWGLLSSILVGIISGIMPALQASRLDPVEAIRK
jgi:putative ABC transport system permease protein